jgi:hypothetical protein
MWCVPRTVRRWCASQAFFTGRSLQGLSPPYGPSGIVRISTHFALDKVCRDNPP